MSSRAGIYYWKCDRAAAFHGTVRDVRERAPGRLMEALGTVLRRRLAAPDLTLAAAGGEGNHLTFVATGSGRRLFVRVEDGPERDDYLEVESGLLVRLAAARLPVPRVHDSDATRRELPFAWHVLDCIAAPDLNVHLKAGVLDDAVFGQIGACIAGWQAAVEVRGHGPFDLARLRVTQRLCGLHASASAYFQLNLRRHLARLTEHRFLPPQEAEDIAVLLEAQSGLLDAVAPVLVHKDLALWNVLGEPGRVHAVIDWDDAVAGDPMDDLALLACFHSPAALARAFAGYAEVRPLPEAHMLRFWAHLLRNMIVKSVIRLGAGYFEDRGDLFILAPGARGADLRAFTLARLRLAARALAEGRQALVFD
jgi:aminoglycoside phosphotransferase (APT) family kinase protein